LFSPFRVQSLSGGIEKEAELDPSTCDGEGEDGMSDRSRSRSRGRSAGGTAPPTNSYATGGGGGGGRSVTEFPLRSVKNDDKQQLRLKLLKF